jgi:NTP pyrophosphatase (non-canonical NTP hydrolase)
MVDIMNLTDLQRFATEENAHLTKQYSLEDERVRLLAGIAKITEETGELAEEILLHLKLQRKEKLDKREKENLEAEIADVILATATLAAKLDIDLDKTITRRIAVIKSRKE